MSGDEKNWSVDAFPRNLGPSIRMQETWFEKVQSLRWKARHVHPLSHIPWSAIRRIGQSRLLALTIIVPFLGSLLLFNRYVVDVLTLSPELVKRIFPNANVDLNATAQHLTLNRLYFVYFGLSSLGIASGLFALLCPLDIKSHATARSYLEAEGPLVTKARMGIIFPNITRSFIYWFENYPEGWSITRQLGEPDDFHSMFHEVITEMYIALPEDEKPDEQLGDSADETAVYDGTFTNHRGRPDPYKIADAISSGVTALQGFAYILQALATKDPFKNDVLTLQYLALDHSRLWARTLVMAFYTLGFGLLLIPTTATFSRLALNVLR